MQYSYKTHGTCSKEIHFDVDGQGVVSNVSFVGGCNGNTKGVAALVEGLTVEEIEERLKGIQCGVKGTSCVDQLAKGVREAFDSYQPQ